MNKKYMGTSEAAAKWNISQNAVSKLCREGQISGAVKNEKGSWQIPIDAEISTNKNQSTFKRQGIGKKLNSINENIIVGVISVALIILLLITVGFNNIKFWLSSPIIWKDPDYITMMIVNKEESSRNMEVTFAIHNESSNTFSDYEFYITNGVNTLVVSSFMNPNLEPYSITTIKCSFAKGGSAGKFFKALEGCDISDINLKYHVKSLTANHEKIFKNTAWSKVIVIVLVEVTFGFLALSEFVKIKWLRILLKIMCVPGLLAVMLIFLIFAVAGRSGGQISATSATSSAKQRAAEQYKRASGLKAGALMHGNTENAAVAQRQMDEAMADMIGGNSDAKQRYKRAAGLKAGATMHGNTAEAARAQREMDSALADMIRDRNKG